jgi:hypothetical protein
MRLGGVFCNRAVGGKELDIATFRLATSMIGVERAGVLVTKYLLSFMTASVLCLDTLRIMRLFER